MNYIKGNLFDTHREIIAHGCNTCGKFGAGIAKQIAQLYPYAKLSYMKKYSKTGWDLGDIQIVKCYNGKFIANMATQDSYGRNGKHVDYDACSTVFNKLFSFALDKKLGVALPKIGAGLGGGDWNVIEDRLKESLLKFPVEVDIYYL